MFLLRELVLGSDVIRPDDDAFRRSVVRQDLGVEALGEGEPKRHQPDYPYDDSGASSRKPGLEGMNYRHVPARKLGNCFYGCIGKLYNKYSKCKNSPDSMVGFICKGILTGSRL